MSYLRAEEMNRTLREERASKPDGSDTFRRSVFGTPMLTVRDGDSQPVTRARGSNGHATTSSEQDVEIAPIEAVIVAKEDSLLRVGDIIVHGQCVEVIGEVGAGSG
jgi:hypothetical protein